MNRSLNFGYRLNKSLIHNDKNITVEFNRKFCCKKYSDSF